MPENSPLGRSFRRLTETQFLTVFNDNAFKQTLLLLAASEPAASALLGGDPQARAGLVFALPFLLLAVFAGDLADRLPKPRLIVATKWAEAGVMLLAAAGLGLGSLPVGLLALFLMGAQSAFLGPAKYGVIPELVARPLLSRANGVFQAFVLGGVLLGTGSAGFIRSALGERLWIAPLVYAGLAVLGARLALRIEAVPAADPGRRLRWNPLLRLADGLRRAAQVPGLRAAMIGRGLFFHVGTIFVFAWNEMGVRLLGAPESWWTAGLASLTVSMAAGSYLAGRWSRGRPRPGFAPLGAAAMACGFVVVALVPRAPWPVFATLLAANFFSGFFLVPLMTLLQQLPADRDRGQVQGACQMIDWLFIVAGSLVKELLSRLGLDAIQTFPILAGILAATAAGLRTLPRTLAGRLGPPGR